MLAPLAALLVTACLALPGVPCEGVCPVQGSGITGFVPPVLLLKSGSTVEWQSLDGLGHVNREGAVNAKPAETSCINVAYVGSLFDGQATFRLEGGGLVAEAMGVTRTCATATVTEAGAALAYQCVLHPLVMKGVLVVVP